MHPYVKRFALLTGVLVALCPAAASAAAPKGTWATVNACDQEQNTMGVRARMPGKKGERLYMHFDAQWYSVEQSKFVPTGASSPWRRVGTGPSAFQAGWTFTFAEPPAGSEFVFRGVVRFQWKALKKGRWRVVRRASKFTTAGHKNVQSAQPAGFSETFCVLKPPA
jgi:hypothetical protein